MDFDTLAAAFRENAVVWMLVFFAGILFWAFRGQARRGRGATPDSE